MKRTSPGQLHQDVDNSNLSGCRSPPYNTMSGYGEFTSPTSNRASLREYEEQLNVFKKENFNLKLRNFFLEEKIEKIEKQSSPQLAQTSEGGGVSVHKENVDLKVENEALRKELEEKQELLCDANKAMNLMEGEQKKNEMLSTEKIEQLHKQIRYLEAEIETIDKVANSADNCQQVQLTDTIAQTEFLKKIESLENAVTGKSTEIMLLKSKIDKLMEENVELKVKLEHAAKFEGAIEVARDKIKELKSILSQKEMEMLLSNRYTESVIDNLKSNLIEEVEIREKCLADVKEKQKEIEDLQEKARLCDEINQLKAELADKICGLDDANMKINDHQNSLDNAVVLIASCNSKIKDLETEVNVYKKSKDKSKSSRVINAEMEREMIELKLKVNHLSQEANEWKRKNQKTTESLQKVINKELWEKNREVERLTRLLFKEPNVQNRTRRSIPSIHIQLSSSYTEDQYMEAVHQKEALQYELNKLIEELAESKNNNSQENEIKLRKDLEEANLRTEQAIKWKAQCSDVSEILTQHLEELACFLASIIEDTEFNINRERRMVIKKAIDRSLDVSKNLQLSLSIVESYFVNNINTSELLNVTNIGCVSISESFINQNTSQLQTSILDDLMGNIATMKNDAQRRKQRRESRERRSLPLTEIVAQQNGAAGNSESETWSEPDRVVSMERIGIDVDQTKPKTDSSTGSESVPALLNTSSERRRQSIARLEKTISEKDNKILQMQCAYMECDNSSKRERIRMGEKIETLSSQIRELEDEIGAKNSEILKLSNESGDKEHLALELELTKVDLCVSNARCEKMKTDIEELKERHHKEIDAMKQEYNKYIEKVESLEQQLKNVEREKKLHCVPLKDYEKVQQEFAEINHSLKIANQELEAKYGQLEIDFQMIEMNARKLRKELDGATIQSSQLALDRTRALKEKSVMENETNQLKREIVKLSPRKRTNFEKDDGRHHNNHSPDLESGIESDVPRVRSVQVSHLEHNKLQTIEITPATSTSAYESDNNQFPQHDCQQIERDYHSLKQKYKCLSVELVHVLSKLKAANERKELMKKNIEKQILKTNNVIQVARHKIESKFECVEAVEAVVGEIETSGAIVNHAEDKEN